MKEGTLLQTGQKASDFDLALSRATLYGALALGFQPPAEELFYRLLSKEGTSVLEAAAALLDDSPDSGLAPAVSALAATGAPSKEELDASYGRLFGHTAHGKVSPYGTEYGAEALFEQPQELGDLAGFYLAFGLTLKPGEHERLDHISCECEFLSFLSLKEAHALEQGDGSMLEETRKANRLFLRDHLGRFVPALAKRLSRADRGGFYAALGELCRRLVATECARLSVPLGSDGLTLRPAGESGVPMACGGGSECAFMPGASGPESMDEE